MSSNVKKFLWDFAHITIYAAFPMLYACQFINQRNWVAVGLSLIGIVIIYAFGFYTKHVLNKD